MFIFALKYYLHCSITEYNLKPQEERCCVYDDVLVAHLQSCIAGAGDL